MDAVSLQFQGSQNARLFVLVLIGVALLLLGTGIYHLAMRNYRKALTHLAAVLGPVGLVPMQLGLAGWDYFSGRRSQAKWSLIAALAAAALVPVGLLVVLRSTGLLQDRQASGLMVWFVVLAVEVAVAVGVFYSSVYAYLGRQRMSVLMSLRCMAILALMLILFKPALSFPPAGSDNRSFLPIVIDRSGSMSTTDAANNPDRYAGVLQQLNYQRARLDKSFRPRWYHFGSGVQMAESLDALAALKPSGPGTESTNIALAVRTVAAEYNGREVPGMVLISDGLQNTADVVSYAARDAGMPIYVLGVGSADRSLALRKNVQIVSVSAPMEVVKNNVSTITVNLQASALPNADIEVRLYEEGQDTPLATEHRRVDPTSKGTLAVDLKYTPTDRKGSASSAPTTQGASSELRKLRIEVAPQTGEVVKEDNFAQLHVLVTEPRIRVLYIEGTIRPEYRDLNRFLKTDSNVQYMSLIRIRENEFSCQGSINNQQLADLPRDNDFKLFDVIIVGDLDRTFLSKKQLDQFKQFVLGGGGLLMLGGHNSFGPGGYGGTAIEEVMPVIMGNRRQAQEGTPLVPQLTAAGEAHPVFEGLSGFFYGPNGRKPDARLPKLPQLLGCVTVVSAKPGATVLALHPASRNEKGPLVVLAAQSAGAGRAVAFTADTTCKWNMQMRAMGKETPYQRFWGQMIRFLANAQTKNRGRGTQVLLRLDRNYALADEKLDVLAKLVDERPTAAGPANMICTITPESPAGPSQTMEITPRADEAKLFQAQWPPMKEGTYRVRVSAVDGAGTTLSSDDMQVTVAPHLKEMDRLDRNEEVLMELANASRGDYQDIVHLPEVVDQLIQRQNKLAPPVQAGYDLPLFNFPVLFIFFAVLITAEWLLRRSWQLH